ncbi:MAG: hypothetical protein IJ092_09405 [Atopobiaceae bacterium]|nr:hypothetical protein [Atopobiaceae bacterium]
MGRASDSGLVHGVSISPQESLEQAVYAGIAQAVEEAVYHHVMVDERLLDELERSGVKFDRDAVQFVTKDKTGQIVWLESGNSSAGLEHILHGNGRTPGHAADFARAFGVSELEIASYLRTVIANGEVVSNELKPIGSSGRMGYERVYYYEGNYHVVTGIGTNGFIVSAFPRRQK